MTYYNEHDPKKAAWLRELIAEGCITDGDVDTRSIELVQPGDLRGYRRCHFFAGVGVWDYALDLAGWGDGPVWTGSCPCPSFSEAGKGEGFDDPRHLWPAWDRLIGECRPSVIFGEQADDAIGFGWLDLVQTDLEAKAYAVGKAVLGACGVGAPHIRQRLMFVGDARSTRLEGWTSQRGDHGPQRATAERASGSSTWGVLECEWLPCKDGKLRAVEPVPESLADGPADLLGSVRYQGGRIFHPLQVKAPGRRLRLHGYGDAIVAPLAAEFITAFMEAKS